MPTDAEPPREPPPPALGAEALLPTQPPPSVWRPMLAATITTAVVTAASYLAPERYAATVVGVCFLSATWWLVLRYDELTVRAHGLSLGGLLEPIQLDPVRLARAAASALGWAVLLMILAFPPFWLGYRYYWHPHAHFALRWPPSLFDEIGGQLVVIALPEEAFFRGYLQTSLDRVWTPRWRILGADLGPGWLVASAIFALGHLLTTIHNPARLAVFFPALLFGWLRQRTGSVGASVLFHASCNIFSATLGRGYHLM